MFPIEELTKTALKASTRQFDYKCFIQFDYPMLDISVPTGSERVILTNCTESEYSQKEQICNGVTELMVGAEYGFESVETSNGSGNFSAPYPTITVTFRPVQDISKLRIVTYNSALVDFTVYILNIGNPTVKTLSVTNNTLTDLTVDLGGTYQGNAIKISISKIADSYTQIRLIEFTPATIIQFTSDQIQSVTTNESIENGEEVAFGSVASSTVDMTFIDVDKEYCKGGSKYNLMQSNSKIQPYIGVKRANGTYQYIPQGVFYADKWDPKSQENIVRVTGLDIISQLDNYVYTDSLLTFPAYAHDVIYEIMVDILKGGTLGRGTGLQISYGESMGDLSRLQTISSIPDKFRNAKLRECLFYIMERCGSFMMTAKDGHIWIKSFFSDAIASDEITQDHYFTLEFPDELASRYNYLQVIATDNTVSNLTIDNEAAKIGTKLYIIKDNPIIQTESEADECTTAMAEYETAGLLFSQNAVMDWIGNPALELMNSVDVDYGDGNGKIKIFGIRSEFDGGFTQTITGKWEEV